MENRNNNLTMHDSCLKNFNQTLTSTKTQEYLQQVLSSNKNSFINNITALVANNIQLQQCEPLSLIYAGIKATALNLPLDQNLGFAYVIPYNNTKKIKGVDTKVKEAQLQVGYKGFIQLAIRTRQFLKINVTDVRDTELQDVNILTGDITLKMANNRSSLPVVGYAAYFQLTNGFTKTLYMTIEEIEAHAKRYSKTYKYGVWKTDFDKMARKTVLKLLLNRYAPLSIEEPSVKALKEGIQYDQAVIDADEQIQYPDAPDTPEIAESVEDKKAVMVEKKASGTAINVKEVLL